MDSKQQASVAAEGNRGVLEQNQPPSYVSMVDSFLVEALQNPRHRLTILRMELDIQKLLQSDDLQQFEFPHFPTSYLRLAAHRVAQHYGLQTMVQDNGVDDGQGIKILVTKKPESKFPAVCLSDVPAKESENDKPDQIKIVIRPRPKASSNDLELGLKRNPVRTVEERKEDYERARARIFSNPSNSGSEEPWAAPDGTNITIDEDEVSRDLGMHSDKRHYSTEGCNSASVAIFRDREKDRIDPDYDRSYDRYVKSIPNAQSFRMAPFNLQNFQPPFVQYDPVFPQMGHMPAPQASPNYRTPVMSPYYAVGLNQNPRDALYMQLPMQTMMYAQSYDQLHASFQAQQPLSFDYYQHHR